MMPVDLKQFIERVVDDRTKYMRHYYAQVVDNKDPIKEGRVLVIVPDLGWLDRTSASWALPRGDFRVPEINDYLEIYFMNGDPARPVYLGIAPEMNLMLQKSFDGKESTKILFDDKITKTSMVFDQAGKKMKTVLGDGVNIEIGTAAESFVKGDTTKAELQKDLDALTQLQLDFTSWVPTGTLADASGLKTILTAGFLTKVMANYSSILSERIKGE